MQSPVLVDTSPSPPLASKGSRRREGGGSGPKAVQGRDCLPPQCQNRGENCTCVSGKSIAFQDPKGPRGSTQSSSVETRGTNPTSAKVQAHSNPDTLFHCTPWGPAIPSSSWELSNIHPQRSSLPVPQAFPLKCRLRALFSLSDGRANRISSQMGHGCQRNRGIKDDAEPFGLSRWKQGGTRVRRVRYWGHKISGGPFSESCKSSVGTCLILCLKFRA